MLLRLELYGTGNRVLAPENQNFYNLTATLHGLVMIFYLLMPGLYGGLGNYLLPVYGGVGEVGFPRVNGLSLYLLVPVSISLLLLTSTIEYPGGTGWTLYPPLCTTLTVPLQTSTLLLSLPTNGVSSLLGSINFLSTLGCMRCPGLGLGVIYLFPWATLLVLGLLLLVLPVLTGALGTLVSDLCINTVYMDPGFGGDPVLYQHLFWMFGHPEVYILILPSFGVLSQVISSTVGGDRVVYGDQSMVLAMGCISILGSLVWGHHIYTVGLEADTRGYFTGLTVMISLPTGTKVIN